MAIIGGGLAGLATAIQLALHGHRVVLFEKKDFPRHKVCGEYVSNEVLPILESFGIDPFRTGATRISRLELSAPSGKCVQTKLPLGAFGLSRYRFDELMAEKAKSLGVHLHTRTVVNDVAFDGDLFEITTQNNSYHARFVVGAFGKHSNLNRIANAANNGVSGKFIGVKRHVALDFPVDLVALHNFNGGYCGVSMVERRQVNVCYLARAADIKRAGGIDAFEKQVMFRNYKLREIFEQAEPLFERPLTIANFSFGAKKSVVNHVLHAGDAAGMITPLCGNGMAMAIFSGYFLADLLHQACSGTLSRQELEMVYSNEWKSRFLRRLWWGNRLQWWFGKPLISNSALNLLSVIPTILPLVIRKTHGVPAAFSKERP